MSSDKPDLYKQTDAEVFEDEKDMLLDHNYDGIRELDNHMPRWWVLGFYFTIVLSVVYLMYYHVLGWGPSDVEEYYAEIEAAEAAMPAHMNAPTLDYASLTVLTDMESLAKGKTFYEAICFACHGKAGEGTVGPNLTDNFAIYGCDLEATMVSIKKGFPTQGMPPYGGGRVLTDEQLHQLASYVLSLKGTNPPNAKAQDPRDKACD